MSNAGRKPIPTKMKLLKGTARKDRINPNEVKPPTIKILPSPPDELNEDGREEWIRVIRELVSNGIFTALDYTLLYHYCYEHGNWKEYERELRRIGRFVMVKKTGYIFQHPLVTVSRQAAKAARELGVQFGLTPSGRTRISTTNKPAEADPFDNV